MNFDFSDDQKMLKDQIARLMQDKCDYDRVRQVLDGDETYAADVWQSITELGVTGAAIPEEYGGLGLGALELCVTAEELGKAAAPIPFSSSIYLAAEALKLAGDEEVKQKYLPKLATGEIIGTIAVAEGVQAPSAENLQTTYKDGKISGRKLPVTDGMDADIAIVLATSGAGTAMLCVDLTDASVKREAVETIDPTRNHAQISFENTPATLLGADGEGWALYDRVTIGAAVLFAFEQVGGAEAALDMAKEYALERYAFGRQIGSYQAIKHKLADMYVRLELARSNCYYAAMALADEAADLEIAAAAARVAATEAYRFSAQENVQTHGGIGYTWEANTQFHYRRSKLLALNLGSALSWKDRIVTALERNNAA